MIRIVRSFARINDALMHDGATVYRSAWVYAGVPGTNTRSMRRAFILDTPRNR